MASTKAFHSSRASGKLSRLIAFSPGYFVFKNENVKVKVKYGFVLHAGFPLLLSDYHLLLENSGMP
jgi:hypothetical protein